MNQVGKLVSGAFLGMAIGMAVLVLTSFAWSRFQEARYHRRMIGTPAPDFELPTLDGGTARLSDYRGRPVLLSFWAAGCPPCRVEAAHLSRLAGEHGSEGLVILAINAWDEPREVVAAFAEEDELNQRMLLNGSGVNEQYATPGVPTSLWINSEGVIVDTEVGFRGGDRLDQKTRRLLSAG